MGLLWGSNVVVVDDDADDLARAVRVLQGAGAHAVGTNCAGEALACTLGLVPDLLIVDIGLPEEDGFALLRRVRSLSPEKGGRVPALSLGATRLDGSVRPRWEAAQFQGHTAKPFEPQELVALAAEHAGVWVERRVRPQGVPRERRLEDR